MLVSESSAFGGVSTPGRWMHQDMVVPISRNDLANSQPGSGLMTQFELVRNT